jgi:hypothetical protein
MRNEHDFVLLQEQEDGRWFGRDSSKDVRKEIQRNGVKYGRLGCRNRSIDRNGLNYTSAADTNS